MNSKNIFLAAVFIALFTCNASAGPLLTRVNLKVSPVHPMVKNYFVSQYFSVSECPDGTKLPLTFNIDCSNLPKSSDLNTCKEFIVNTACLVYPAYKKITDVPLEERCKEINYTIYTEDNWPLDKDAGGISNNDDCSIAYVDDYAFQDQASPLDVHEILHQFQASIYIDSTPDWHNLFEGSVAEAYKLIGAYKEYKGVLDSIQDLINEFFQVDPPEKVYGDCGLAERVVAAKLYWNDPSSIYDIYKNIVQHEIAMDIAIDGSEGKFDSPIITELLNSTLIYESGNSDFVAYYLYDVGKCNK